MSIVYQNLDANESIFFTRELEKVKSKSYDIKYPEFKAKALIPVSGDAGAAAESITYRQYDMVGLMKIISDYADDLPRSDVKGTEYTSKVRSIGGSYGYSIQEIRASQATGRSLPSRKATAVRRAYEQKINDIAWWADGTSAYAGLKGLIYADNITVGTASTGNWIDDSVAAATIIGVINTAINAQRELTKGLESPDTVVLPISIYGHLAATPRSTTSDTTILEFLRKVNPGVSFEWANEMANVTTMPSGNSHDTDNIMLIYRRDPERLTLEIPQPFEQFAPQQRGLEFVVPAHGRVGGVIVYYPLSVSIVEGI